MRISTTIISIANTIVIATWLAMSATAVVEHHINSIETVIEAGETP